MTIVLAIGTFSFCFALMTIASVLLGGSLENLAMRLRLSGGVLGMLAALGADTPEIASAASALLARQHDLGVGIIIGSNLFNLAALLGFSAVVAGRLPVRRQGTLFNGAVSLIVTLVLMFVIFRWMTPLVSLVCLMFVLVPYISVSDFTPQQMKQWRVPETLRTFLIVAIAHTRHAAKGRKMVRGNSRLRAWWIGPTVLVIIGTSLGMVHSAIVLSDAWGVNKTVVGMLILAALTSIPNAVTALQLALDGRGIAVMSESLNSNTINILCGICVPAAILGLGPLTRQTMFSAWWLLGTTMIALGLLYVQKGFTRMSGALIVALYGVFGVMMIGWK